MKTTLQEDYVKAVGATQPLNTRNVELEEAVSRLLFILSATVASISDRLEAIEKRLEDKP